MYKRRLQADYINNRRAKLLRKPEKIWTYISRQKRKIRTENGGT